MNSLAKDGTMISFSSFQSAATASNGPARPACPLNGREYCYVIANSEGQSCRVGSLRPQWQDHFLSYDWAEKDAIGVLSRSGWKQVQKIPLKADALGDYSQSFFLILFGRELPKKAAG